MNRRKVLVLSLVAAAMLSTGCTRDKGETKETFINALTKQSEIKQYTFAGSADLDIGLAAPNANSQAATASLISMFGKSKWSWEGASAAEPFRMEGRYTLNTGDTSFTFPLIFRDDVIYMSVPLLNKKDEYFSFDLKKLGASQSPSGSSNLKNINIVVSRSLQTMVSDFDYQWFKKMKKPTELMDGSKGTLIRVEITDKNKAALTEKVKIQLAAIINDWETQGLMTKGQAVNFKTGADKVFAVTGGEFTLVIDEAGFIRTETINVDYSAGGGTEAAQPRHFYYRQEFKGINAAPDFKLDTPKHIRPIDEVLELLKDDSK
ncbi:MAG: hypothetical protein H7X86_12485 [Gorillibacterium sp.]|nr:hypothetical protein [Gorillibacterium sp.]